MFFRGALLALLGGLLAWADGLPHFSLVDTAGQKHTPVEWTAKRAVVLFFSSTDCPQMGFRRGAKTNPAAGRFDLHLVAQRPPDVRTCR